MADTLRTKKLFRDIFRRFANASVREGTAIVDEIINPLVLLEEPLYERVEAYLEQMAIPNGQTSSELLDIVADRWLVDRRQGSRARAGVVIILSRPERIEVPGSARFYTQDRRAYRVVRSYSFDPSQLVERTDGTYATPDIIVEAVEEGGAYQAASGEIVVPSFPPPSFLYCYNPAGTTSGSSEEDDESLYDRIRSSISSRAMDTTLGLTYTVQTFFAGDVERLLVVGSGEPEMERDAQAVYVRTREVPLDITVRINLA